MFSIAMTAAEEISPSFHQLFLPLNVPQWVTFYDTEQESEYYYNPATYESVWDKPETNEPPIRLWNNVWQPMFDIHSQNWFFYNIKTGESRFELPTDETEAAQQEEEYQEEDQHQEYNQEYNQEDNQKEADATNEQVSEPEQIPEEEYNTTTTTLPLSPRSSSSSSSSSPPSRNSTGLNTLLDVSLQNKLTDLAEQQITDAKKSGKHCAKWIEVIDPVSKKTAYYSVSNHSLHSKKPKGWVKMMSNKYSKRRLQSIQATQEDALEIISSAKRQWERTRSESGRIRTGTGSSVGTLGSPRRMSRRMSNVVLESMRKKKAEDVVNAVKKRSYHRTAYSQHLV